MGKFKDTSDIFDSLIPENKINVKDEKTARFIIDTYGYYNVINAYRDLLKDNEKEFEYFYNLFQFDQALKSIVLKYILLIETHYKHVLSKALSEEIGESVRQYLNVKNYKGSAKSNLSKAVNKINFNEKPMSSYTSEKQGIDFPPWIFLKSLPFGNSIKIYTISKADIKDRVANEMITNTKGFKIDDKKRIFIDNIEFLRQYRNKLAHGNRLINHKVKKKLNYNDCQKLSKTRYVSIEQFKKGIGESDLLALFYSIMILTKSIEQQDKFLTELFSLFEDYEVVDNQKFIDIILKVSNLPNNFQDIMLDARIIWR
ncbi:Abi family protein [Salinicoccus sesuvii]|uniref:Abi family protein n=1 Tax=Salinicoccus sesuvii TaxID=868281 RepID=A0ABV7N6B1_9STAP